MLKRMTIIRTPEILEPPELKGSEKIHGGSPFLRSVVLCLNFIQNEYYDVRIAPVLVADVTLMIVLNASGEI